MAITRIDERTRVVKYRDRAWWWPFWGDWYSVIASRNEGFSGKPVACSPEVAQEIYQYCVDNGAIQVEYVFYPIISTVSEHGS